MDPLCKVVFQVVSGQHWEFADLSEADAISAAWAQVQDLKALKGKAKGLISELKKRG